MTLRLRQRVVLEASPRAAALGAASSSRPRPAGADSRRQVLASPGLAERPSGLDCRPRSACLSGTPCVACQAGGTIRLSPAVAEAGSPRRKAICATCSLYELRPESRDVGRRPPSESHRKA